MISKCPAEGADKKARRDFFDKLNRHTVRCAGSCLTNYLTNYSAAFFLSRRIETTETLFVTAAARSKGTVA